MYQGCEPYIRRRHAGGLPRILLCLKRRWCLRLDRPTVHGPRLCLSSFRVLAVSPSFFSHLRLPHSSNRTYPNTCSSISNSTPLNTTNILFRCLELYETNTNEASECVDPPGATADKCLVKKKTTTTEVAEPVRVESKRRRASMTVCVDSQHFPLEPCTRRGNRITSWICSTAGRVSPWPSSGMR